MERYSRQEAFFGIGSEGQKKLLESRVCIIGLGALGSASANLMARAGTGFLRLVDRDYVELSNLQRQMLYTEADAAEAMPKAAAAADHLGRINSEIRLEPVVADVNSGNIRALIEDVDLIIDATDNVEIRLLINEACHALGKPWIYGGALASYGMTMNILPGEDRPCYHCMFDDVIPDGETCATAGVLGMLTSIVASIQCTEAVKILIGSPDVRKTLLAFDIWNNEFDEMEVARNPDCPVCGREEYRFYGKVSGSRTVSLCGRDSVQIVPAIAGAAGDPEAAGGPGTAGTFGAAGDPRVDFDQIAGRWQACGKVTRKRFTLDLDIGDFGIKLFPDGRAIISGTSDEGKARALYDEYVGL